MELVLVRTYHPMGTNGTLYNGEQLVCLTIELPWKDNKTSVSCIPEGRYELVKRYSEKYKWHLLLKKVPNRSFILIHPANDALKELRGCIAPVSQHMAPGKGLRSRIANGRLQALVFPILEKSKPVFITIKSSDHENS
jgi:hypothetical protein